MSTTLRLGEAFTIPDVVSASDFVLQIKAGVEHAADAVSEHVVTSSLSDELGSLVRRENLLGGSGTQVDELSTKLPPSSVRSQRHGWPISSQTIPDSSRRPPT